VVGCYFKQELPSYVLRSRVLVASVGLMLTGLCRVLELGRGGGRWLAEGFRQS